jgi:beta-lactamase superfamily II metal-dependent hydrolase
MLLTGDARGDKILEGLEMVGLVRKVGRSGIDLLKVPHHGSSNNLDDEFFERIMADHPCSRAAASGNPERESWRCSSRLRGDDPSQFT